MRGIIVRKLLGKNEEIRVYMKMLMAILILRFWEPLN